MSLSDDAAPKDSSDVSAPTTFSFESTAAPLHSLPPIYIPDPTASDPAYPLSLHSKQQQDSADNGSSPQTPPDASLSRPPLVHQADELPLILVDDKKCMEADDDEEKDEDQTPKELALLLQRSRQPRPGTQRVMKMVRIRKGSSSSKRRTKKHTLRVQLKDAARIEEEMAEYRVRGKKERPIPERRSLTIGSGTNSRGRPSCLRFSESCYSDMEDEGNGEENEIMGTLERNSKVSTQQCPQSPMRQCQCHGVERTNTT